MNQEITKSFEDYLSSFEKENNFLFLCNKSNSVPLIMTFTEGYSLTVHYYVKNNSCSSSINEHLEENKKNPLNLHCCCEIKQSHSNNVLEFSFVNNATNLFV